MNKKTFWLMTVVCLSNFSQAQTNLGNCGDVGDGANVQWSIQNDTLIVSGSGGMKNYESTYLIYGGSESYSTNAPWFEEYNNSITTVVIQPGVTNIGDAAFAGLSKLQSVSIPNSVTSLGEFAFARTAISSISLSHITNIGWGAFQKCNDIRYITILNPEPPTIPPDDEVVEMGYPGGLSFIFTPYEEVPDDITIYVPAEAVETYEADTIWGLGSVEIGAIIFTLTLNKNEVELYIGSSETLTATVSPDNATNQSINWSSNDESVATVNDDGLVYAVSVGMAWITATSIENSGIIADSCLVTVSKKPQSITGFNVNPKTYGDPAFVLTASSSSGLPVSYAIAYPPEGEPPVAELSGEHNSTVTIRNAGRIIIFAHQDGDSDNAAAMVVSAMLIVNKATLTVTPNSGQHKTYGDVNPEFTYQVSDWKYEDAANATGILSGSLSRDEGENVGMYNFTQGNLSAGNNYDIVIASDVKFTIDKATLTVTPDAEQHKTYGEDDPEFTCQVSGWKYEDA
ncbi:MAG: leucine-rich repeat protein, partial [Dysgonamonadaceae bacterium]|nr:leucine-rich repeat protein [Dysgonamonadaceae bacterium]